MFSSMFRSLFRVDFREFYVLFHIISFVFTYLFNLLFIYLANRSSFSACCLSPLFACLVEMNLKVYPVAQRELH